MTVHPLYRDALTKRLKEIKNKRRMTSKDKIELEKISKILNELD